MGRGSWRRLGAADLGETREGYEFERVALHADRFCALITVTPETRQAWLRLVGERKIQSPPGLGRSEAAPSSRSVAPIRLL